MKGIRSLMAYVMKSDVMLIPVFPGKADVLALAEAAQPGQLVNYGDRAWVRLH